MCGRYSQTRAQANLIPRFRIADLRAEVGPRDNNCPSQRAPVIFYDGDRESIPFSVEIRSRLLCDAYAA
jgi:putative SOS response-associated peptidase YedK